MFAHLLSIKKGHLNTDTDKVEGVISKKIGSMQKSLLALLFTFSMLACQDKKAAFTYDIPSIHGQEDWMLEYIRPKIAPLRLDSLEAGFDSVQIRIWYDYALWNPKMVTIVKKTPNQSWEAKRIYYYQTEDAKHNFVVDTSEPIKVYYLQPTVGWESFYASLLHQGIFELPGMPDSILYSLGDGDGHEIEVATENTYRFYSYHNIDHFKGQEIEGLDKMRTIDSLLRWDLEIKDSTVFNYSSG